MTKVPVNQRCYLTIPEAASYFSLGEKKLRKYVKNNADATYVTWNGSRALIHRELFEKHMIEANLI